MAGNGVDMRTTLLFLITIGVWLCVIFLADLSHGGDLPNQQQGIEKAISGLQEAANIRPPVPPGEEFLFIARCSLCPWLPVSSSPTVFPVPEDKHLVITDIWLDGEDDSFLLYDENMDDWYHRMHGSHWQGTLILPPGYGPQARVVSDTLCPRGGLIVVFFARGYYWIPDELPVVTIEADRVECD
jgi:hypothetical protein